jgi:hypothetical protein
MTLFTSSFTEIKAKPPIGPNEGLAGGNLHIQIKSFHIDYGNNQAKADSDLSSNSGMDLPPIQ